MFSEVVECSVKTCQVEAGQCSTDAALSTQTYQGFYGDFTQMGVLSDLLPTLGATTTAFKEAVLKLDVTPNITPDDRILLDLIVNQDSVGDLVPSGNGCLIPTIDTTELTTQVLVGNGETVVLGSVFKNEELVKVERVPLLGDIPYLGTLFKSTANTQQKTETLIFITPRILSEALVN